MGRRQRVGWRAVALPNKGFHYLTMEQTELVRQDGSTHRGESELATHLAHGVVVGGAHGGRGKGGVADRHMQQAMDEQRH